MAVRQSHQVPLPFVLKNNIYSYDISFFLFIQQKYCVSAVFFLKFSSMENKKYILFDWKIPFIYWILYCFFPRGA